VVHFSSIIGMEPLDYCLRARSIIMFVAEEIMRYESALKTTQMDRGLITSYDRACSLEPQKLCFKMLNGMQSL
jgi:hypothetical protein